ncbi:phosphotyrosine protein phosphatase I superfamily [Butyriboletus roseoflavus]|nr:phosphotyrosine protein phosphatase I superfamily [Butyriboletus roseoflavus]
MGEAVLRHEATKRGIDIEVDSAGTGAYHVGEDPDDRYTNFQQSRFPILTIRHCRTISTCKKHNIPIDHSARQVKDADFSKFQYILAADESNLRNLMAKKPREGTATVRLWGSYLANKPISDPYYGDIRGFEQCFEDCTKLSNAFLDEVVSKN